MEEASRRGRREAMTVSFSGIDGAGKSTQIEAFSAHLKAIGMRVRLIAFWDDVARFKNLRENAGHTLFHGDKGVGRPDKPIERRDKNVRSRPMTAVRYLLYLADALSLRSVAKKAMRSGADVVIFDRYAYDELVNLTLSHRTTRAYARMVMKIVPRPTISYVIDADPVAARARKPEYPLEFLHTCRNSYLALGELVGGMTIIAPAQVREVEREVWRHAVEQMALCGIDADDGGKTARLGEGVPRAAAS